MRFHLKRNIPLMYAIAFLQGLVFYGSISTVYRQAKGLSMSDIFIIESVSWVVMIFLEVPWGLFADRFGYKKTLAISNFIFFLSKVVFFAAASFPVFLTERILLAVALSGLSGCDIALLHHSMPESSNSERVFATYRWFGSGGLLAASLLSPLIIGISMETTTAATIIPYAAAAGLTLLLTDTGKETRTRPDLIASFRAVTRNGRILLFVIGAALVSEAVHGVTVFLNQNQYARAGIDIRYFGPLLALTQLVGIVSLKSHRLSGRFGKGRAVGGLFLLITASCVGLALTASPVISILLICLTAGASSLAEPMIMDLQNSAVTTGDRATVLSGYAMCGELIAAGASPLIGFGSDISVQTGFLVCAAVGAFACILLLIAWRLMSRRARHS